MNRTKQASFQTRAEANAYRSILAASQASTWLLGQALRGFFAVDVHRPPGLFEHGPEERLILAPLHRSVLDPWLIMGALEYRQWRALIPVRALATQTFSGPLRWFGPFIRLVYRVEGVLELPPKDEDADMPEKLSGLLKALRGGEVVAIFPEGGIWKERVPPVGEFAPGVVYLQRHSGADIVPIAVWKSRRAWPRRRYIIEIGRPLQIPAALDLDAGAAWLRARTLELHERARRYGVSAT